MLEVLKLGFALRAAVGGAVLSLLFGLYSVPVVLRRLSFTGAGISHAAFAGVALGYFLKIDPTLAALLYSGAIAIAIGSVGRRARLPEDAAIGIFFCLSMALGIAMLRLSRAYGVDIFGYLFGNILSLTPFDLRILFLLSPLLVFCLALTSKELLFLSFDQEVALVSGVPVTAIHLFFLVQVAALVVIGMKMVGAVLVSALLVLPGATARQLTSHYRPMILCSAAIALTMTIVGLAFSFLLNIPSGASIVLVGSVLFGISLLLRRRHSAWSRA